MLLPGENNWPYIPSKNTGFGISKKGATPLLARLNGFAKFWTEPDLKFSNQLYIIMKGKNPRKKINSLEDKDLVDFRLTLNFDKSRKYKPRGITTSMNVWL